MESGEIWADQILDERLWLGSGRDASNLAKLSETGITHVLNCSDDVPNFFEEDSEAGLIYLKLNIGDFGTDIGIRRTFEDATRFVKNAIESVPENKVLIHCANGSNRSVTVTIAVLMTYLNFSLSDAWGMVFAKRKQAAPLRDNRAALLSFERAINDGVNSMTEEGGNGALVSLI
jgi:hypothetical protein